MYDFTTTWFEFSELKKLAQDFIKPGQTICEIGAFEGAFVCFVSDNFEPAKIVSVDPFLTNDSTTPQVNSETKQRYLNNIAQSKNFAAIQFENVKSRQFWESNKTTFDFIYIDGSHLPRDFIVDLNFAIKYCRPGGIIWCDDYDNPNLGLKVIIDKFVGRFTSKLEVVHRGYQIGFRMRQ